MTQFVGIKVSITLLFIVGLLYSLSYFRVRKRHREERIASTAQRVQQMKQRLTESERKQEKWQYWRPILFNVGAGAGAVLAISLLYWMYSQ